MNEASGPQGIQFVTYRQLDELPAFAARRATEHQGEHLVFLLSTPGGLDPLCRVMTRALFLDGIDAQIARAPLRAAIAFDAFVHRSLHRLVHHQGPH
jgi:hypothetical protein